MRRITLALLVVFVLLGNIAQAQLEVVFTGNPIVQPGGQVSVDVSVNNFTNLFGVQFSMNWDSLVLQYNTVTNIVPNSILPDVSMASIGDPSAAGVDPGQATFSWFPFDGTGKTVPDGTVLFTLVFDGIGAACSSTSIVLSNDPRIIEVSLDDGNNTDIGAVSSGIALEIDCGGGMMTCPPNNGNPNCGSGTIGSGLGIIGSDHQVVPNTSNVCMDVTVDNFTDVQSMEMNVVWDASVINYSSTQNYCPNITGFGASNFNFIGNNMGNDTLRMVWFDFSGSTPATLPNGKVLLEICFDAVGPNPSYTDVQFLDTEFGDSNQATLSDYTDCGSVDICEGDPPPATLNLYACDVTVDQGDPICVPVKVDGFTDIQSFQFTIDWIDNVLAYSSIQNINPALQPDPLFNPSNGILPLNWFTSDPNGVTLTDGSILFEVCYDFIGDCDGSSNTSFISFIDQPSFEIEFGDIDDLPVDPVTTEGATVTIDCPDCNINLAVTQPDCPGDTGSILVSGGEMPYQSCDWTFNGSSFDPGGCNVFAGLPGAYSVTVVDANGEICIENASIVNPTAISFNVAVQNISCNGAGSVTVQNPSGGTGLLTQTIVPQGPYTTPTSVVVTVSDANMCSLSQTVMVGNDVTDLMVDGSSSTGSCSNEAGTITVTVSGGCPAYSATGAVASGNTLTWTGLMPGDYTQVISDSQGNMVTVGPINVPFFDAVTASPTITDASFGGTDGIIDLGLMGGATPYMISIDPVAGTISGDTISNLPPGNYTVTIIDANGCELVLADQAVGEMPDGVVPIEISTMITSSPMFGGFGVACNGDCNGSVLNDVIVSNGPLTSIVLSDDAGNIIGNDLNPIDLCAGQYTLTVIDSAGVSGMTSFEITEPDQLVISTFSQDCDTLGFNTGAIDVNISGGVPDYTYMWNAGQFDTQDVSNIPAGNYNLMVTDANDCIDIEDFVVEDCEGVDPPDVLCYNANNIITPGGTAGINDVLFINCAGNNPNTLTVYDRWGEVVHSAVNYNNTWNGVDTDGTDLGEGNYYWIMEATFPNGETRLFKGYVTILRDL